MNNFKTGRSGSSQTYDNEILCAYTQALDGHYADFEVLNMEVWGFEQ